MLHRQWMKIRSETSLCTHKEQVIQFLRDAVLLLHSLSQKDKLFHEHCLEVLHQYDQAMPGVRAILKKTEKLSASEGKKISQMLAFLHVADIKISLLSLFSFNKYQSWLLLRPLEAV